MLSEKELSELITETYESAEFSKFRSTREENDLVRNMEQAIPLPEVFQNVFVPRHRSYEAQHASNVQMQELKRAKPSYSMYSRALESSRQEGAQNFEHFMNRQLIIWLEGLFMELVGNDQINRGVGMGKLDLLAEPMQTEDGLKYVVWPDKPSRNGQTAKAWADEIKGYKLRKPTPFVLEHINIMACAWEETKEGRIAYAVEKSKRKVLDIAKNYGWEVRGGHLNRLGPAIPENYTSDPQHRSVEFAEICTDDYIYHVIGNVGAGENDPKHKMIGFYPNPFGACRYILFPGMVRSEVEVWRKYVPLIEGPLVVADERSYFGTMRKFAAACAALPIFDVIMDADGMPYLDPATGKPMEITLDPFSPSKFAPPPGAKIVPRFTQVAAQMDRYEALLQQDLQRYGPSEVLTGGSAGEREPAWALALRGEKAEGGIAPVLEGLRTGFIEIARRAAWCIKNYLDEEVLIWTVVTDKFGKEDRKPIRVRPDDIEEDFDTDLSMGYQNTALQLAQRESLRRGKVDGDVSRRRLQEEGYNIADPISEDRQITLENVKGVLRKIVLWPAIQAAVPVARERLGLPPASPDEIAALQAAVFGVEPSAEARRPASGVHTTEESPPTPVRQRVI